MACNITFDDGTLGIFSGTWNDSGVFDLVGYSTTIGGTYGAGGNWPWSTNVWGASVNPANIITGFYKFNYHANVVETNPCYDEIEFIIPVVQGTGEFDGSEVEIELCSGSAARNIFNDSGAYAAASILPVIQTIGGDGLSSPGYDNNGTASNITDDTFDPSQEASYPQTIEFTITYTPATVSGYPNNGCDDCDIKVKTVRYIITEEFIMGTVNNETVCNDGEI